MLTLATVANATNTQTRRHTESYLLSQLFETKSPGRQSTLIVAVHGQSAISTMKLDKLFRSKFIFLGWLTPVQTGVKLLELQLDHPLPQPKPSISNG
jgi:hypothetical protein